MAASLGPTDPNPAINLTELDMVKTIVQDSPNKLFIGGLPCEWTEDQVSATCCYYHKMLCLKGVILLFFVTVQSMARNPTDICVVGN